MKESALNDSYTNTAVIDNDNDDFKMSSYMSSNDALMDGSGANTTGTATAAATASSRADVVDGSDSLVKRLENELADVTARFRRGDLQAFGKESEQVFSRFEEIRSLQDQIATDHMELELTTNEQTDAVRYFDSNADRLASIMDDMRLMQNEITRLHHEHLKHFDT